MNGFQTYRGILPVPEKRVGTEETSPGSPELGFGFGVAVFGLRWSFGPRDGDSGTDNFYPIPHSQ
jgi:hypothetical protein